MSYITLLITIPLTVFSVLFVVSNTGDVTLGLWPLERTFTLSSGVFGLLMLGGGFFLGALFVWIHSQKMRFNGWRATRRASRLEKELESLHEKSAPKKDEAGKTDEQAAVPALPAAK
ncbi:MAG: DUF1049 domain-containing protein [Alphaproteobacteria bacterium]|nr:DUF1049 domain-containing protein [Alphaproteobacteria bacterium]